MARSKAETYRHRALLVARAQAELERIAHELQEAATHAYRYRDAQVDLARAALDYAAKVRTLAGRHG